MRLALAMICKGDAEEAKLLDRCLSNVKTFGQVDQFFITATYRDSIEETAPVAKVVKKHKGVLSTFKWVYDFAEARNFNFSQVPKDFEYIMWCDADDAWRGLGKLKTILTENPHVDALGFWYFYDWDEYRLPTVVHRKTMVVKNDGCVTWQGRLHEDLIENRQLDVKLVPEIDRLHLSTSERAAENAVRNLEIAKRENEEHGDDPRTLWNLANSQFAVGSYADARDNFEQFIKETGADEEKYLAYQRVADCYKSMEMREEATASLMYAIGMRPELPDAYYQLAYLYCTFENWKKAEYYCLQGMVRKPKVNALIVYNPRDYDYNPMRMAANIYFNLNRPDMALVMLEQCAKIYPKDKGLAALVKEMRGQKEELAEVLEHMKKLVEIEDLEELKKELDAIPDDMKSHPMVSSLRNQKFIKTESSGRDLVIYCGHTDHEWNPEMFKKKGVGGSEEAVIHLARQWAKLGWNVTVYNNCGHKAITEQVEVASAEGVLPNSYISGNKNDEKLTKQRHVVSATVTYRPFWEFNYRDKQDVVILWRWVKALDADINAPKIFVDLHDVVPYGEFNEARLNKLTKVFVKTKFHRSLFPNIPDEKIVVVPNGMEAYIDESIQKDPLLVINTSSPDRSMDVLPALWKRVKAQVPEARLSWAYGWEIYKQSHSDDKKKMQWMKDTIAAMEDAGIEILGRLPQHEVGKLYQQASFLAYPTEFAEISCISALKAQMSRCVPIATDFGALDESIQFGYKIHSTKGAFDWNRPYQFHFGLEDTKAQDEWVETMVACLKSNYAINSMRWDGLEEWGEKYKWSSVAKEWHEHFV